MLSPLFWTQTRADLRRWRQWLSHPVAGPCTEWRPPRRHSPVANTPAKLTAVVGIYSARQIDLERQY